MKLSNEAHLHRKLQTVLSEFQAKKNQPWTQLMDPKILPKTKRLVSDITFSFCPLVKIVWCQHACMPANISHVDWYSLRLFNSDGEDVQRKFKTNFLTLKNTALLINIGNLEKCCSAFQSKFDPQVWSLLNVFKIWNFKYHWTVLVRMVPGITCTRWNKQSTPKVCWMNKLSWHQYQW